MLSQYPFFPGFLGMLAPLRKNFNVQQKSSSDISFLWLSFIYESEINFERRLEALPIFIPSEDIWATEAIKTWPETR